MFLKKKRGFTQHLLVRPRKGAGFTLLELLVVIAIIGLLSTITVVSLGSARSKARDSKRIADLRSIQLALEFYNQENTSAGYPASLSSLSPTFMATVPVDPKTGGQYYYRSCNLGSGLWDEPPFRGYHLGGVLEISGNPALVEDADSYRPYNNNTGCGSGDFHGQSADCVGNSAGSPEQCYDLAR